METTAISSRSAFNNTGDNMLDSAVRIARDGDLDTATAFAQQHPESAHLLGDAFASHNLGLLHALQDRVRTAFAGPHDLDAAAPTNGQSTADAGRVNLADYDIQSIRDHEATPQEILQATIPTDRSGHVLGQSGVTIGYGFDVGQRAAAEIQGHVQDGTITQEFADRILPYAGRTGNTAQQRLAEIPIEFTQADRSQLELLSDTAYQNTIERIDRQYYRDTETATGQGRHLSDLPRAVRTAIADVGIQYGHDLPTRTPNFWNQITHGHWSEAADNLNDFGDEYTTRRHDNEALFREAMNNGLEDWGE